MNDTLLKLLLGAFPDRLTVRREDNSGLGVMTNGRGVALDRSSIVRKAPLFLSIDAREVPQSRESIVSIASGVEEPWLEEIHPHLLRENFVHIFNPSSGRIVTKKQKLFLDLPFRTDTVGPQADPEGAARALADYIAHNWNDILANDEIAADWLGRVLFLRKHMPELALPEFTGEEIREVMDSACKACSSIAEVQGKTFRILLESKLTWEQRQSVDQKAPERIQVPSGSNIRLRYGRPEEPPVLPVRLQEMFGATETPTVAAGRVNVLLHLLGPNFRPVQVTSDLRGFWERTYADVRKDLRARYPRHPWPEDPWTAKPKSVGGRRK